MSEQLTIEEMQEIYDVFRGDTPADIDDDRWDNICEKMLVGLRAMRAQEAHAKEAYTETFPQRISEEEAQLYQQKGMRMMLEAAALKLDERTHADLSCLFVALLGRLSQATSIPREVFSNTLVADAGFTALKAAWNRGKRT